MYVCVGGAVCVCECVCMCVWGGGLCVFLCTCVCVCLCVMEIGIKFFIGDLCVPRLYVSYSQVNNNGSAVVYYSPVYTRP